MEGERLVRCPVFQAGWISTRYRRRIGKKRPRITFMERLDSGESEELSFGGLQLAKGAPFRATDLPVVVFRMGVLAVLRSKAKKGKQARV